MNRMVLLSVALALSAGSALAAQDQSADEGVKAAVAAYDQAVAARNLDAVHAMLAPDLILYEHSVRNIGLEDAWEHHLKEEIAEAKGLTLTYSDMRVWASPDVAVVTREYAVKGTMDGRAVDSHGNETLGWVRRNGAWQLAHIHYSHPCPRAPAQ